MISKLNRKNEEDIKKSTIEILQEKLLRKIQKEIDKGMDPLSAYEQALKGYELQEEIIITYEIEAEKAALTNSLDLKSSEIKYLEDRLKKSLFNEVLKEI